MNILSFDTKDSQFLPNQEPVFSECLRRPWILQILTAGEVRQLSAGTTVVAEGQQDTEMFILLEGQAEVMAPLHQDWVSVALLGPGNFIGEMAFLDDLPRSARVIATTPLSVLVITRERFLDFAEQRPMLALNFMMELSRTLAHRLRPLERVDAK